MVLPVHHVDVPDEELRFHTSSGRLCLDLVATIGERWRGRFERLRSVADLDRWLATVALPVAGHATERDLEATRRLRGAIELLAIAAMAAEAYRPEAVDEVNAAAGRPDPAPQLTTDGIVRPATTQSAARAAIARDAVDLFGGPLAGRVRECDAPDCALVFVDTSRPGTRRWCSMRACGNRQKVSRHRAANAAATTTKEPS